MELGRITIGDLLDEISSENIKGFCAKKNARFKIPSFVIFTGHFPTTSSGKVQKYVLRDQAIKALGREEDARIETA